jgi:hypothetical protein
MRKRLAVDTRSTCAILLDQAQASAKALADSYRKQCATSQACVTSSEHQHTYTFHHLLRPSHAYEFDDIEASRSD